MDIAAAAANTSIPTPSARRTAAADAAVAMMALAASRPQVARTPGTAVKAYPGMKRKRADANADDSRPTLYMGTPAYQKHKNLNYADGRWLGRRQMLRVDFDAPPVSHPPPVSAIPPVGVTIDDAPGAFSFSPVAGSPSTPTFVPATPPYAPGPATPPCAPGPLTPLVADYTPVSMDAVPADLTIRICGTPAPYGPIIGPDDVKLAALHNTMIDILYDNDDYSPAVAPLRSLTPLRCSTPPPM